MSEHRLRGAQLAALLGLLAILIYLATDRLVLPWIVSGRSMEPALAPGDLVIVDLWSYRHRQPREGEVVLFDGPEPSEPPLVKRVAAPPASSQAAGDEVWLLGDNPEISDDSRRFGPVPADRIRGRVVWRYWPLSRAGPIVDTRMGTAGIKSPGNGSSVD
jgi:nickel-type superoxide dismutase maturation protease